MATNLFDSTIGKMYSKQVISVVIQILASVIESLLSLQKQVSVMVGRLGQTTHD